jgi:signal transduction histidine kinase
MDHLQEAEWRSLANFYRRKSPEGISMSSGLRFLMWTMIQFENPSENEYNPDMSSPTKTKIEQAMPALIGYLVILAVAVLSFQFFQTGTEKALGIALLAGFTVLYAIMPGQDTQTWKLHLYLGVMTAIVAVLMSFQPQIGVFPMLFFVLSPIAMMVFPQRMGIIWIGIYTLVTAALFFVYMTPIDAFLSVLPYAAGYGFFGAFARTLANAEEAREESQNLLSELQTAHRQLQEYAAQVEELAVAEERNRLSREMHDTIGHRLTVSAVQLEGAQRLIPRDPQRSAEMVETAREQVREALRELRSAVATLREPLETDLPVITALQRLVNEFDRATDLNVHLILPEEQPPLSNAQRLALYRAAQEALTNVQRHAQAQQVWVQVTNRQDCVLLSVSDDGIGFPAETKENAFGLHGMRERAAHLGGELILENRQGGGAQLQLRLPLMEEISDDGNDPAVAG